MRSLTLTDSHSKIGLHMLLDSYHTVKLQNTLLPEEQAVFKFEENFAKFRELHRASLDNLIKAFGSLDSGLILEQIYSECLISLKETITNEALFHSEALDDKSSTAVSFIENWIDQTDFPLVGIICWVKGIDAGQMIIESKLLEIQFNELSSTHQEQLEQLQQSIAGCNNSISINTLLEESKSYLAFRLGLDKVAVNLDSADVIDNRDYNNVLNFINRVPAAGIICLAKGFTDGQKEIVHAIKRPHHRLRLV